jgi:hypothetical protein
MATEQQNEWVLRVLGFVPGTLPATDIAALRKRLLGTGPALTELKAAGAPELPQLLATLEAARTGLATQDGPALLDRLEQLIARARSAERVRQAKVANVRGIAYPKLLLQWRTAQGQARAAVEELGRSLLAMPEVQADPRFERARQAVTMLPGLIPDLGSDLVDLLDKGITAASDDAIAADALAIIGTYRGSLAAATSLGRLEAFAQKHADGLSMLATLDAALAGIATSLQASASM